MIIAVVGAGGKTTVSHIIGKRLAGMGRKVLFTTTTKILMPPFGEVYLGEPDCIKADASFLVAARRLLDHQKLKGYSPEDIQTISGLHLFDDIVVEADGANRKPIKIPNDTEPVYPPDVDLIIGVIGLDSLGQPLSDDVVHRKELFAAVTGASLDESITISHALSLINHPGGLFKSAPASVPKVVFLNKCDTINSEVKKQVQSMARLSSYPILVTGYNVDWFEEFYRRYIGVDT